MTGQNYHRPSGWDTRRMLGDLGHDIETNVFTIIDIANKSGPITRLNVKGLIQSDSTQRAIRPKMPYHAVQQIAPVFDHSLERLEAVEAGLGSESMLADRPVIQYSKDTNSSLAVYAYQQKEN